MKIEFDASQQPTTFDLDIYLELLQGICFARFMQIAPVGVAMIVTTNEFIPIFTINKIIHN